MSSVAAVSNRRGRGLRRGQSWRQQCHAASSDVDSAESTTDEATTTTRDVSDKGWRRRPSTTSPRGDQLFSGSSGDNQIGCIACDGGTRFLHPNGTSTDIAIGAPGPSTVADKWEITGHVVAFGANLHTSDNVTAGIAVSQRPGRSQRPGAGRRLAVPCRLRDRSRARVLPEQQSRAELVPGDMVSISLGEAGNVKAKGDYSIDWWFVFEPVSDG